MIPTLISIGLIPVRLYAAGWATVLLWGWFITPVYGVPAPSIYTAVGVNLLWQLFKDHKVSRKQTDPWETLIEEVIDFTVILGVILGAAALWRWLQWGL